MRNLALILLMMLASFPTSASEPVSYSEADLPVKILPTRKFHFFNSKNDKPTIDWNSIEWIDATKNPYRTEQNANYQWIKFSVKNDTDLEQNTILYHSSNFTLENMEVYRTKGEELMSLGQSGAELPIANRTIRQRAIGVPLKLEAGETVELVVHAHSTRPFKPDFGLTSVEDFYDYIQSRNLIYGFCMGIQFIVFMIAGVFAYRLRDRAYAWFALMALSTIVLVHVSFGYTDASPIFSHLPVSSSDIGKFIRPAVTILVLSHTAVFLSIRQVTPGLFLWFQATMISLATLIPLSFTAGVSNFAISGADRLIFLGIILMTVASFKAWRRKTPQAGYFLIATTCLILSVIPWLVVQVFALSVPRFALDLIPIGQAVQMSLMTLALMAKVRSIDEARTKAEIEAGKNEELKSLVRVLSHDLANPMSVVLAYAQKGIAKCYDNKLPEISQYFEKILKSTENQITIIDHIKAMRAVQDGKSSLHLAKVSLLDVMRQVEAAFEQALASKKLKLVYDVKALDSLSVWAESASLSNNVVNNLISNAIKFSHPGDSIEITTMTSDDRISLIITDHGIGIPKDMIANIFRADKPTSRPGTMGERGTGYGMPLVHSYIKKFGGDISIDSTTEAESPERHGTRVTVSLKKAA